MNSIEKFSYKFYPIISMTYITLMLSANVMLYKIIKIYNITITVGSLITPFWFIIGDIVTEIYGYSECRKLIWRAFFCSAIFTIICSSLSAIPSPMEKIKIQEHFNFIFSGLPRIFIISIIGILMGSFANSFIISKFKILVQGKYLFMRIIGASFIGQFLFTFLTLFLNLFNKVQWLDLKEMIIISCTLKMTILLIIAYPLCFLIYFIKQREGFDSYDYNTDFNPFKFN